jgi:hypothetical protein
MRDENENWSRAHRWALYPVYVLALFVNAWVMGFLPSWIGG